MDYWPDRLNREYRSSDVARALWIVPRQCQPNSCQKYPGASAVATSPQFPPMSAEITGNERSNAESDVSVDKHRGYSPHSGFCTCHCWHSHAPSIYPIDAIASIYKWSISPIRVAKRQTISATSNWANRLTPPNWIRQICTTSNPNTIILSNEKIERSAAVRQPLKWASAGAVGSIENRLVLSHLVRRTSACPRICPIREISNWCRARWVCPMMQLLCCHNTTMTATPNRVAAARPYRHRLSYNFAM